MEELKNEPNTLKQIGYAIKDSGIFQSIYAKKNNIEIIRQQKQQEDSIHYLSLV